jgi:VanZ family protein
VLLIVMMAADLLALFPLALLLRHRARLLHTNQDGALSLVIVIAMFVYLVLALRRAYLDGRLAALVKALALVVGMAMILFVYRLVLFYTTFWTT